MTPRRRQGAGLLAGAAVTYVLLGPAGLGFHWTPLVTGLACRAAAFPAAGTAPTGRPPWS